MGGSLVSLNPKVIIIILLGIGSRGLEMKKLRLRETEQCVRRHTVIVTSYGDRI